MDIKRETERAIKAVSDARTTYVRAIRLHLKCIDHHDTPYHYADISLRNAEEMLTAALMSDVCKPNSTLDRSRPPNTGGEDSKAQQGGKAGG